MNKAEIILVLEKHYDITLIESSFSERNSFEINERGDVISLNLSDNQISDISILEEFTSLVNLNLSNNKISDISVIKKLPLLEYLRGSNNQISDISMLEGLSKLTSLSLDSNKITNILSLKNMPNLKFLALRINQISDISPLENLTSLTSLSLLGNQIVDISVLCNLTSLRTLHIWSNQINDISVIKYLVSLEYLDLGKNEISDISHIQYLENLKSLDLSGNNIIDFSVLTKLESLISLSLNNCFFSDISLIAHLKSLRTLFLSNNEISDISGLENLNSLRILNISNNIISDISILKNLTLLTNLDLTNNRISNILSLESLVLLTKLNLSINDINDVSSISNLKSLTSLSLMDIDVKDFTYLSSLTNLDELFLSHNEISDISFLENLENLSVLNLGYNNIRNLSVFLKLKKIAKLYLNDNHIYDLNQFNSISSLVLYIQVNNNPCFKGYDVKFENFKNHRDTLLNLFKKISEEKNEYVLPTKVLLLGNTGCGKSTLLDYILQDKKNKVFKNNLASTHIIQVETFPKKIKRNSIPEAVFYDFGGQDYYHGLYKAFLSNESLNILLWNNQNDENKVRKDRNEQFTRDYDRNYWLYQLKFQYDKKNNNELNKRTEPIILIQTHADNELSKRETYKGNSYDFNIINEFYLSFDSVSISENKTLDIGLRYFEETLYEQIRQKQIKKYEPIWYKNFLNYILRSTKKSYINLSDLASEYKRESDIDNKLLPEVLREIAQTGLILYYKDDKDLKDVAWLNPSGIIEDIHDRVLSKDSIKKNKGIVGKDFFDNLIKDEKLIKLLVNQKVIFLDEYDNNYIIPGYLPLTEEEDKLYELLTFDFIEPNFILKFEHFIPFGLINQLVCFYGKGKSKKHYWRDQLLFTKGNSKVLIKLDFTNLEILVSIKSKDNNTRIEKIQQEIFTDILDIYWDKNDKYKIFEYIQPKYYKFHDFDGKNIDEFKNISIKIENSDIKHLDIDHLNVDILDKMDFKINFYNEIFKDSLESPDDLYISIDNKFFVNHKDLEDKDKTVNKIMSFGLETRKEIQNNKEIEIRKIDKTKFSEKASGLYRSFTTNKNTENMKRIFISYAKENKKEVNEFQKQIAPFKLSKEVETWHCSELQLGEDWESKIKGKFYEADIILYFISTDFFSTPFILDEEVKRGIERDNDPADNVVLIPIILEKIHWEDLLGKYSSNFKGKAINSYDKSNNAWYEIVDDLKKHHFRKVDPNTTAGILGQSKEKMKAQEDIIEGKL